MPLYILILAMIDIHAWQNTLYSYLISSIKEPISAITKISNVDTNTTELFSYAAFDDSNDKYYYVIHDIDKVPTWLFVMNYKNKIYDELWHHDLHDNIVCNTINDENILFHLKTIGIIKTDILMKAHYKIENTKYGVITKINIDNTYASSIKDLELIIWIFPHPIIKHLAIIVVQGYIKTQYPIRFFTNSIQWHINTAMENFGKRLKY